MPMTDREAEDAFHTQLVRHGLIVPVSVAGIFGRGAAFEDVLAAVDGAISIVAKNDGAFRVHFPPVVARDVFERSEFMDSFPQLTGTVFSFVGNDAQHKELAERIHGGRDWSDLQAMTDVVLTPAACYPIYPSFTGTLPPGGRTVDMWSYCFRHEPSGDPARMQMFRVREFVRAGEQQEVLAWREMWLQRGLDLLLSLGLAAKAVPAADPFFGRGGRLLAVNQREQGLKFEVVVPICSSERPTAVCSFNYHQEHFTNLFKVRTSRGTVAQTACLGFGLERIVMALFKTHGFEAKEWPGAVRQKLWP
jgi:seryl-tRNA synthetase